MEVQMTTPESKEEYLRYKFYSTTYKIPIKSHNNSPCPYCGINRTDHTRICNPDMVIEGFIQNLNNDEFLMVHQIFNEWCCMNNDQRKLAIERYYKPEDKYYSYTYHTTSTIDNNSLIPLQMKLYFSKFIIYDPLLSKSYYSWYNSKNEVQRLINYMAEFKSSNTKYIDRAYQSVIDNVGLMVYLHNMSINTPSRECFVDVMNKIVQLPQEAQIQDKDFTFLFLNHALYQYDLPDVTLSRLVSIYSSRTEIINRLIEHQAQDLRKPNGESKLHRFGECKDILYYLFSHCKSTKSIMDISENESKLDTYFKYFGPEKINSAVAEYIQHNHESYSPTSIATMYGMIFHRYKYNIDFSPVSEILSDWVLRYLQSEKISKERDFIEMIPLIVVKHDNIKEVKRILNTDGITGYHALLFFSQYIPYHLSVQLGDEVTRYYNLDDIKRKSLNYYMVFYHGLLKNCYGSFNATSMNELNISFFSSQYGSLQNISLDLILSYLSHLRSTSNPICRNPEFQSNIRNYFFDLFKKN
ncbi:hypothetical protein DLAC_06691 [Tieghemostelium lacteum]|uniref:Uncharacterized protein n=1 Tax=Tieghemostelium lacteum TaxID=361077 RepID=A0A151ZFD7_TIELA|nr:hypothetical protein DLAC_06691 [Tieghemostelium lacteum]|eukprot:KYQ92692.1 hypothetical protein DLAC_06691 [Tieghemostelium lacteum]